MAPRKQKPPALHLAHAHTTCESSMLRSWSMITTWRPGALVPLMYRSRPLPRLFAYGLASFLTPIRPFSACSAHRPTKTERRRQEANVAFCRRPGVMTFRRSGVLAFGDLGFRPVPGATFSSYQPEMKRESEKMRGPWHVRLRARQRHSCGARAGTCGCYLGEC